MLSQRSTPIKLSQEAAEKIPRRSFFALIALFLLGGFFATDLWTNRDISSFSYAYAPFIGSFDQWLMPVFDGTPLVEQGPLTGALSALLMRVFGTQGLAWLNDIGALRLSGMLWSLLTVFLLWKSAYSLAKRPEARPVSFAFGGEASPKAYARTIADCTVLLFIASFGLIARHYEAGADNALVALVALNLYALVHSLSRPVSGSALAGVSIGAALWCNSLTGALCLLLETMLVTLFAGRRKNRDIRLLIAVSAALGTFLLWPAVSLLTAPSTTAAWFSAWAQSQWNALTVAGPDTFAWFAKNALWFLYPAWPLALWGIYSAGRRLTQPYLLIPVLICVSALLGMPFSSTAHAPGLFLTMLPGLSILAAFGLLTLRRGFENMLDWFCITVFSLGLLTLWAYWLAWFTGFPPKMAHSIDMLAPGTHPVPDFGFALAAALSVIWIFLAVWRLTHRPCVIWRGPWLAACGLVFIGTCSVGLFDTAISTNRSYDSVIERVDSALAQKGLAAGDCVVGSSMSGGLLALFDSRSAYRWTGQNSAVCRYRLVRHRNPLPPDGTERFARPRTDESFSLVDNNAQAQ